MSLTPDLAKLSLMPDLINVSLMPDLTKLSLMPEVQSFFFHGALLPQKLYGSSGTG